MAYFTPLSHISQIVSDPELPKQKVLLLPPVSPNARMQSRNWSRWENLLGPNSESDIKSGLATAPRKVVSNSYQTYRTTSGMKWTNFRLRAPLDQLLLSWHRHPEKRRLHSLQNSKGQFRTLHLIWMWQNHATGAILQINNRPPEWTTLHTYTYLTCLWPASFRNSRSK